METIKTTALTMVVIVTCLALLLLRHSGQDQPRPVETPLFEPAEQSALAASATPTQFESVRSLAPESGAIPAVKRDRHSQPGTTAMAPQPGDWLLTLYPELARIVELENLMPDEALGELLPMLSDKDPVVRLAALESLADMNHPALLPTLSAALADPEPQVRILALRALGSRDNHALAVSSIEPYLFDPENDVRLAAIEVLSNLENAAAAQALAGVIFDPDTAIRQQAVNALGEIGGETAVLYLLQAQTDPDPGIRANAGTILGELGEIAEY